MADVKVPISANVKGVLDELSQIERKIREVEKAGERLGRIKFKPIDAKEVGEELKRLEAMMLETHRRVRQGGTGMGGAGAAPGAPGLPAPVPSGRYPTRPAGGGGSRGGFGAYTHAPHVSSIPQSFASGVGGGFSQVAGGVARGAIAGGYGGGGMMGMLAGAARATPIVAAAFAALKVGQATSEGYGMAVDRAGTLDTLKRQLGDVGISFEQLKVISDQAAQGLQVNAKEAAELAAQFNRLSRGHGGIGGLADGTRTGLGLSRAYGLDAGAGVNFVGSMANMDRRQNNRELALLLAEAVNKSGMSARADEVMQALLGYASTTSRMVMGTGGLAGYAGAYGSLMGMNGMTSENAAGILGAANSSVMRMGGAGEAGQNFTMMALGRGGRLNPIQAMALSEGGLFGTRGDVFGAGGAISKFIGGQGMPGGDMNMTNFSALRSGIRGLGGDKWLQLDAAKRYFGVGSMSQAAALMNLDDKSAGSLMASLKKAGIDPNTVNASGIQALAAAGPNASASQLQSLAKANREETEWTKMQDGIKALETAEINVGDKLIGPINTMRDALVVIAGKLAPDSAFSRAEGIKTIAAETGKSLDAFDATTAGMKPPAGTPATVVERTMKLRAAMRSRLVHQMATGFAGVDPALLQGLAADEKELGLPEGTLIRQDGIESGFNLGLTSPAGAMGLAQIMPANVTELSKRVGRKLNPFDPNDARLMQKMLWKENLGKTHNDVRAAAALYHAGSLTQGPITNAYADVVSTPLPAGAAPPSAAASASRGEVSINGTFVLKDQQGNQLTAPLQTRVSVPRGSGTGG